MAYEQPSAGGFFKKAMVGAILVALGVAANMSRGAPGLTNGLHQANVTAGVASLKKPSDVDISETGKLKLFDSKSKYPTWASCDSFTLNLVPLCLFFRF